MPKYWYSRHRFNIYASGKYKVDKIPTHGKLQTRFHFGFKIAALNFQKLLDYTNNQDNCAQKSKVA